jgi:hypothetical protein
MPRDQSDPLHHAEQIKQRLRETIDHLREDIKEVDEPKFRALAETSAEVLGGLMKAFDHYETKAEAAWQ